MNMFILTCVNCGKGLRGRTDKRFCCDACRNSYHNTKRSKTHDTVRRVDYILHKNRDILKKLKTEKAIVEKESLSKYGFNFSYHTHINQVKEGPVQYFCYEYGYYGLNNDYCALIIRKDKPKPKQKVRKRK